jgi:hypothetical protein
MTGAMIAVVVLPAAAQLTGACLLFHVPLPNSCNACWLAWQVFLALAMQVSPCGRDLGEGLKKNLSFEQISTMALCK